MSQNDRNNAVHYVKASSVPICLRHGCKRAALSDAEDLADFLQESVENMFASGSEPSSGFRMGLNLCFCLLKDKLAIASGELPFPMVAIGNECGDSVLWTPEPKETPDVDA